MILNNSLQGEWGMMGWDGGVERGGDRGGREGGGLVRYASSAARAVGTTRPRGLVAVGARVALVGGVVAVDDCDG